MPLPQEGDLNWAPGLNDYIISVVQAMAEDAQIDINTHQVGSDPHGDRSYSAGLVNAVTTLIGAANGLAQLGPDSRLLSSQSPTGGGKTNVYDVVKDYSAPTNGTSDAVTHIQAAINACGSAGGGEVWIPDGTYAIGSDLKINHPNIHINLSDGATIKRIAPISAPRYMLRNFSSATTSTVYTGIGKTRITGGTWDANATNIVQSCNIMAFSHAEDILIDNVRFQNVPDTPALLLVACKDVTVENSKFRGFRVFTGGTYVQPAIAIEVARDSTVLPDSGGPSYDSTPCVDINIRNNVMSVLASLGAWGGLVGSMYSIQNVLHDGITITENRINNANEWGVYVHGWRNVLVSGNRFLNCNGAAVAQIPSNFTTSELSQNVSFSGNAAINSGVLNNGGAIKGWVFGGFGIYTPAASPTQVTGVNLLISDNTIKTYATEFAIRSQAWGSTVITNNSIVVGSHVASRGIMLSNNPRSVISGNKISGMNLTGITLTAINASFPGEGCKGCSIVGNVTVSTGAQGITVNYSDNVGIVGNTINSSTTASIGLFNNSDKNTVVGNNCDKTITTTGSTGSVVASNIT